MSDQLKLNEVHLRAAVHSLTEAAETLRDSQVGTGPLFQSVTGIAEPVCQFLSSIDLSLVGLGCTVYEGAETVTEITDEATQLEQQLSAAAPTGFVEANGSR